MKSEYTGREVVGFKFVGDDNLPYASDMDMYIGQKGKITCKDQKAYRVDFCDDNFWWYPFEGIEEQLVEPAVVEPELTLEEILEKIKNL